MAYVNLGQVIYPVGAIFASTSSTSPSSMFGGTWSQIGGDSCLMACDNSVGAYGSSKKITINNMPSHNHPFTNLLGCGWEGNSSENDRLGYSRYKAGRNLSQFGQSSYQGGGAGLSALLLQMLHVETHCLAVRSELASQAQKTYRIKKNCIEVIPHA